MRAATKQITKRSKEKVYLDALTSRQDHHLLQYQLLCFHISSLYLAGIVPLSSGFSSVSGMSNPANPPELPDPAYPDLDSMLTRKFGREAANYFSGK